MSSFGNLTIGAVGAAGAAFAWGAKIFYADQLDNPVNTDWIVNALAPAASDSMNAALTVRLFDDAVEEGVGFILAIPSGATNMKLRFKSRAEVVPGAARTVGVKLYYRQIPDDAAVSATWAGANDGSKILADIDIPANVNFQYSSQTLVLVADFTPDLLAAKTYQFELTRVNPTAGTELVDDWALLEVQVEFS